MRFSTRSRPTSERSRAAAPCRGDLIDLLRALSLQPTAKRSGFATVGTRAPQRSREVGICGLRRTVSVTMKNLWGEQYGAATAQRHTS
jgi:hypothetical protein